MTSGELLSIEPIELKFPFELKKQISCSFQLSNKTDNYVAFKVKTTNPKKYCVRPNTGVVLPRTTCDVTVTMQAQREAPPDMQCKDKFLLQSVIASPGAAAKDVAPEMFNKESGNLVDECKLRVVYVSPPQPPSPVEEGSEEGSSPRASSSDNGNMNGSDVSRAYSEPHDKSSEMSSFLSSYSLLPDKDDSQIWDLSGDDQLSAKSVISKLTEEKNSAIQLNNNLRQELELMKREVRKGRGGRFSFIFVVLVGLLGVIVGYLMRRT